VATSESVVIGESVATRNWWSSVNRWPPAIGIIYMVTDGSHIHGTNTLVPWPVLGTRLAKKEVKYVRICSGS